jgi:hypothetical protein
MNLEAYMTKRKVFFFFFFFVFGKKKMSSFQLIELVKKKIEKIKASVRGTFLLTKRKRKKRVTSRTGHCSLE